jgi:hypothetical protein
MSRKYGENIKGIETTYEIRSWSIKGRALVLALIEAAQGTNSQDIGPCLPIVLGLGSKHVNFNPTRARASKAELPLDLALWRIGSCRLFFFSRRLRKASGPGNIPAADHFGW